MMKYTAQKGTIPRRPKMGAATEGLQVRLYPVGWRCNLACEYCPVAGQMEAVDDEPCMSESTLQLAVRQIFAASADREAAFHWKGGEPLLAGLSFFQRAVRAQKRMGRTRRCVNTIYTNGTLLTDEWCAFFAQQGWVVVLTIDGPKVFHDAYRCDVQRQPTFDRVMRGILLLKKHKVHYITRTHIHDKNAPYPLEVYDFLRGIGDGYMTFAPMIQRITEIGTPLPPSLPGDADAPACYLTPQSIAPAQFSYWYLAIFNEWLLHDVGKQFVSMFEDTLSGYVGLPGSCCAQQPHCGLQPAIFPDGSVLCCDCYIDKRGVLGNINRTHLSDLLVHGQEFGELKYAMLPDVCRLCPVLPHCNGGCPAQRARMQGQGAFAEISYLCEGYRNFYTFTQPYFEDMATLYKEGYTFAEIMDIIRE